MKDEKRGTDEKISPNLKDEKRGISEKNIQKPKDENYLNKIFDSFITQTIFKNKLVLQPNYIPQPISHRDAQITQVASIIAPSLRLEKPSNLFIYGLTGTGKTLVVQHVKNELLKKSREQNIPLTIIYLNCKLKKVADTEYRILAELIRKLGSNVPSTGLPTDHLYRKFISLIDEKKQNFIFVLDEIDQAINRIGDEFLYNFTRLNTELNNAQISIIGISNDLKFLDTLDPRIRSSLGEEEILFPPYNAIQLQDILRKRASESLKEGILDEGVIEKCAAYAAREHGDARRAIDLLRIASELVERDNKNKVTQEYIDKAKEKIESDKIVIAVEMQPKQFQIVLLAILKLFLGNKFEKKESKLFTGNIYNAYCELCKRIKIECLTQRRISDIIGEFDMQGLINAKVISKGRYGRMREIRVDLPLPLVQKINKILVEALNI